MEDDRRVWPPGSSRATPPLPEEPDEPWNPRLRRTGDHDVDQPPWESLPPSARYYGKPARPSPVRRWRRRGGAVLALVVATGLVAGLVVVVFRMATPREAAGQVVDAVAGVTLPLPQGWREVPVAPVTGFTSVVRDERGLVMARAVPPPMQGVRQATAEAAELYSRLLLKGDTVEVVDDRGVPQGYTRALRAAYQDVVNRPAYLRVTLLTRDGRYVLLVGLLQPADNATIEALDAVMATVR